ncbi:hypothetical protein V6Z12_D06G042500 [Gossypium hirsutum]
MYNYSGEFHSLEAYNMLDKKHLPVKWSSEFSVDPPRSGTLFRLGNGKDSYSCRASICHHYSISIQRYL